MALRDVLLPSTNISFVLAESIFLTCQDCSVNNCSHIRDAFLEGIDADLLWALVVEDWNKVRVPLIATQNVYSEVTLVELPGPEAEKTGIYEIYIPGPLGPLGAGGKEFCVGMFSEGESLNAIRSKILNYLEVEFLKPTYTKCGSNRHGFSEEMAWQSNALDSIKSFIDKLSLYEHGTCQACFSKGPQGLDDVTPGYEDNRLSLSEKLTRKAMGLNQVLLSPMTGVSRGDVVEAVVERALDGTVYNTETVTLSIDKDQPFISSIMPWVHDSLVEVTEVEY